MSSQLSATGLAALWEPADVAGLTLRNRFVMAPMTRFHSPGGVPGANVVDYYERRAPSVGLVITEGTYVDDHLAGGYLDVPHFFGDDALAGWNSVRQAVQSAGARIFPQLWHLGVRRLITRPDIDGRAASPSGLDLDGAPIGEGMNSADIDAVIAAYATAAANAQQLGFDGVELHGAHGYLLDQFLWSVTNRRDDSYGGELTSRARLAVEVVRAIRGEVGSDFPISYRFSQWKGGHYDARGFPTPHDLEIFLDLLTDAGVSVWHPSTRQYWTPAFPGSPLTLAGWTKRISGNPTMAVGSVGVRSPYGAPIAADGITLEDIEPLGRLYDAGELDLAVVGRALLSDAEWVVKVGRGDTASIRSYRKEHESTLD